MNKTILCGNITRDIDLKFTEGSGLAVAKFNVAVARMKKDDPSDFINCVAFGKTAETIANYMSKGSKILIEGRIQTGSYENKEGNKVYTTDIIVDRFEFVGSKKNTENTQQQYENIGMQEIQDDGDIPF